MVRRSSTERFERIEHLRDQITLHQADLLDQRSLVDALRAARPTEIYNLAAMSFVAVSWIQPTLTAEFTGVGVTRMLEAMREVCPEARFYQASSSEMFGKVREVPQNELTPFYPRSPVRRRQGLRPLHHGQLPRVLRPARLAAGSCSTTSRRAAGSSSSPARSPGTPRRSSSGWPTSCALGNLDAERDWGYAKDYVEAMWLMLQQDEPDDYVIATGVAHSVRDCVEIAFDQAGLDDRRPRRDRRVAEAPGRGRPPDRRRLQGQARARLGAADELRGADPADGRRRLRAAQPGRGSRQAQLGTGALGSESPSP